MDSNTQSTKQKRSTNKRKTKRQKQHNDNDNADDAEKAYTHTLFSMDDVFGGAWSDVIEKVSATDS